MHSQLSMESGGPIKYPEDLSDLVGRRVLFQIDRIFERNSGGVVYFVHEISTDTSKIDVSAPPDESESKDYDSDSDLELLFERPATVGSNLPEDSSFDCDDLTPLKTPSKRTTGDTEPSTQDSTNKKLKAVKQEKP